MNAQDSFKQVPTFSLHDENFVPVLPSFVQCSHLWNMTEIFCLLSSLQWMISVFPHLTGKDKGCGKCCKK
jgi:hypothetical protein